MLKKNTRIAWMHSHFLLWAGGTKFIYEVVRRIHKTCPVDIYVERCSDYVRELYRQQGITVHEINSRTSYHKIYWLFFPFFLLYDIIQIRKIGTRYPVFVSSMFPMNFVARQAGILKYAVYLFEPFAFFHDEEMIRGFPVWKRMALRALAATYKKLDVAGVRGAARVMTINKGTAAWVKKLYDREATLSYLATDPDFFHAIAATDPKMSELRKKYAGRKIIIHSTDFTPLKKTDDAIAAVEEICKTVPKTLLIITQSSRNEREEIALRNKLRERNLEGRVTLAGFLSFEDLRYYYSLADIFLYTGVGSGASAASLFVLECMSCETPGVRTDFTKDEIVHNVSGFLYEAGDQRSLVTYAIRLLTDDALRKRFGEAARQKVVSQYSWTSVAETVLQCIEEVRKQETPTLRGA